MESFMDAVPAHKWKGIAQVGIAKHHSLASGEVLVLGLDGVMPL